MNKNKKVVLFLLIGVLVLSVFLSSVVFVESVYYHPYDYEAYDTVAGCMRYESEIVNCKEIGHSRHDVDLPRYACNVCSYSKYEKENPPEYWDDESKRLNKLEYDRCMSDTYGYMVKRCLKEAEEEKTNCPYACCHSDHPEFKEKPCPGGEQCLKPDYKCKCLFECCPSDDPVFIGKPCPPGAECIDRGVCIEIICNDKVDNDGDGSFDCDDPDCAEDPACLKVPKEEETICDDRVDNDDDGLIDCDDPDCAEDPACLLEVPPKEERKECTLECCPPRDEEYFKKACAKGECIHYKCVWCGDKACQFLEDCSSCPEDCKCPAGMKCYDEVEGKPNMRGCVAVGPKIKALLKEFEENKEKYRALMSTLKRRNELLKKNLAKKAMKLFFDIPAPTNLPGLAVEVLNELQQEIFYKGEKTDEEIILAMKATYDSTKAEMHKLFLRNREIERTC